MTTNQRTPARLLLRHPVPRVTGTSPYRPTRREFLAVAGSLLILAPYGCGSRTGAGGGNGSDETRTAEGHYGEIELPADPQRLVPGYTTEMDYALVLGIPMAAGTGATGSRSGADQPFAEYQQEAYPGRLEGLERVQTYPEANYEQIAVLNPDCILDQVAADDEGRYERFSEIAPTFVFQDYEAVAGLEFGKPDWRGSLRKVGRAFGAPERADEYIADYESRVEVLRGRLAERWSDSTFAAVWPWTEFFGVFGRDAAQVHQILFDDLGLTPASVLEPDTRELSLETLPQIDADVLFFALPLKEDSLERDRQMAAPYLNSPLWQEIPAVQKDQVYEFDQELIYTGPLTAAAFLNKVESSLLG
ncbi:MAG: ABC transporter substrate-binding protein [Rubrobacteraceae bacterium]